MMHFIVCVNKKKVVLLFYNVVIPITGQQWVFLNSKWAALLPPLAVPDSAQFPAHQKMGKEDAGI